MYFQPLTHQITFIYRPGNKTLHEVSVNGGEMTPLEHSIRQLPNVNLFYVTKQSAFPMTNNIENLKEKSTVTWR